MKIGMIGTGNMGKILIEAMVEGKAISPEDLFIYNRTKTKALDIKKSYPAINISANNQEIAKNTDLIFLCVKPHDTFSVAKLIAPYLKSHQCVVSITSPINPIQLESVLPCSVARIIPSITNRALAGVSLFSFGNHCTDQWKTELWMMFENFSTPLEIEDSITRVASDIVSCGPAFFSYLTQRFIDGAVEETNIDEQTATKLASEMLIGLGELLKKEIYTLPTLQEKVNVKGGITGEGLNILEQQLGDIFNQLFQATQLKFEDDQSSLKHLVSGTKE
ncbi:MAG TPA: late competence protein ComER [Niallia sp.]|nr:late competence protein ComER [Niallia sp.]